MGGRVKQGKKSWVHWSHVQMFVSFRLLKHCFNKAFDFWHSDMSQILLHVPSCHVMLEELSNFWLRYVVHFELYRNVGISKTSPHVLSCKVIPYTSTYCRPTDPHVMLWINPIIYLTSLSLFSTYPWVIRLIDSILIMSSGENNIINYNSTSTIMKINHIK